MNNTIIFLISRLPNFKTYNISKEFSRYLSTSGKCPSKACTSAEAETSLQNPVPSSKNNEKLIKVAIIGVPNAGKSTFINNLINHRVCPTSRKVHTTRSFSKAITTKKNAQIILFDTPGLVTEKECKKHHLESSFLSSSKHSIQHSDLIGVLHDCSNSFTRNELPPTVMELLKAYPKIPSILILNKIDCLKSKRVLLDLTKLLTNNTLQGPIKVKNRKSIEQKTDENLPNRESTKSKREVGWSNFAEIFMVSAITGDGMTGVMNYIFSKTKQQNWEYSSEEYTDQSSEEIIEQSVRARLLDYLPQEIPYLLQCHLEFFSNEKGKIFASVQVHCPSKRVERLVCGSENGKLKQITEQITSDLVETFQQSVSLTLSTITPKKLSEDGVCISAAR